MKLLSLTEVQQISGGFDPADMIIGLFVLNIGLGIYNYTQINKTTSLINYMADDIDFLYNWTIYQEAQLSLTPHYDEVRHLNLDQAYNMIPY